MKTLEMAKATVPLAEYAQGVNKEPIILTVDGRPVAALVPIENADLETVTLSSHPQFLALIERSRARQKSEGGIPSQEMRRRLRLRQKVTSTLSPTARKKAGNSIGRHKVYAYIVKAVKQGTLKEPFATVDFRSACPGLGEGTYKTFLHKHALGNPGRSSELLKRVKPGQFKLLRPIRYGLDC